MNTFEVINLSFSQMTYVAPLDVKIVLLLYIYILSFITEMYILHTHGSAYTNHMFGLNIAPSVRALPAWFAAILFYTVTGWSKKTRTRFCQNIKNRSGMCYYKHRHHVYKYCTRHKFRKLLNNCCVATNSVCLVMSQVNRKVCLTLLCFTI